MANPKIRTTKTLESLGIQFRTTVIPTIKNATIVGIIRLFRVTKKSGSDRWVKKNHQIPP